jgi:8-oxo-dGTP pyrophosphatase MutT (NUDIX family)
MYGWTPNPVAKAVIYEMQKKLGNDPAAWPGQRLPPILHEDFAKAFPKRATLLEAAFVALFTDASLHKAWGDIESVWFLRVGDRRTGPGVHWHWAGGLVEPRDGPEGDDLNLHWAGDLVEPHERFRNCARRELAEELGWHPDAIPHLYPIPSFKTVSLKGTQVKAKMYGAVASAKMMRNIANIKHSNMVAMIPMKTLWYNSKEGVHRGTPFLADNAYGWTENALTVVHETFQESGAMTDTAIEECAEAQRQHAMSEADFHEETEQRVAQSSADDWDEWN